MLLFGVSHSYLKTGKEFIIIILTHSCKLLAWRNSQDFLKILFYSSLVDLQCCVNFCCTTVTQLYMYILFHILFHYGLSEDIEYSSLCCTVGAYCLSILCIIVCICSSQTPHPSLSRPPHPLGNHKSVLCVFTGLLKRKLKSTVA